MKENKVRCDIPGCFKIASRGDIFCIDHGKKLEKKLSGLKRMREIIKEKQNEK